MNQLSYKEYKFVCELLWGCVPVDRIWAEETNLFKDKYKEILEKYPLLDKSFKEEYEKEEIR